MSGGEVRRQPQPVTQGAFVRSEPGSVGERWPGPKLTFDVGAAIIAKPESCVAPRFCLILVYNMHYQRCGRHDFEAHPSNRSRLLDSAVDVRPRRLTRYILFEPRAATFAGIGL